jgi:MFS family permease
MKRHKEVNIYSGGKRTETNDGKAYPWYVLGVLVLVCVFNFIDRQILSILAEDIKVDIGLSDSQIGFLYGTAFALFYAVFGIPLGRLADVWIRKNLIAGGLFLWSAMTALSGTARSFFGLGAFRIGVGVGEASATPAVFSLLADYFPRHRLATVLSIYCSGVYIGSGLGMLLGGWVVDAWNGAFAKGHAPLDLSAWQAAFIIAGLPGILVAVWVWTLREPVRGQSEGIASRVTIPNLSVNSCMSSPLSCRPSPCGGLSKPVETSGGLGRTLPPLVVSDLRLGCWLYGLATPSNGFPWPAGSTLLFRGPKY